MDASQNATACSFTRGAIAAKDDPQIDRTPEERYASRRPSFECFSRQVQESSGTRYGVPPISEIVRIDSRFEVPSFIVHDGVQVECVGYDDKWFVAHVSREQVVAAYAVNVVDEAEG